MEETNNLQNKLIIPPPCISSMLMPIIVAMTSEGDVKGSCGCYSGDVDFPFL